MKPEIKAMLGPLPGVLTKPDGSHYYTAVDIEHWFEKLTEGAEVMYGAPDNIWDSLPYAAMKKTTHTALLICPREIKKQTPLEIAERLIKSAIQDLDQGHDDVALGTLKFALEKIEAAK